MAINFNPNLPPNDAPSDELIIEKLGGLMLGDPEAFDYWSQPDHIGASWDASAWDSIFEEGDEEDEEEGDEHEQDDD
jgi:hypothetical protein